MTAYYHCADPFSPLREFRMSTTLLGSHRGSDRLRGIASMLAAVCVFAVMDASLKRFSERYGLLQVASMRCVSSWLIICAAILWQRKWLQLRPSALGWHAFRAVLGITMLVSFVYAVKRTSLAETYSVFLCAPLLMTALSVPMHGETVPPRRWLAIAIGLAGVLVILRPGAAAPASMSAVIAAGIGALCYALSALTVRSLGRTTSNTAMVFWYLAMVGFGSGILAIPAWRPIPSADWVWLAIVGLSGALGQFWLTDAFRRAPPSVVGPFEYTSILWAFAIDWFFWSATPTRALLIGSAIVIASGLFVIIDEHRLAQLALAPGCPPP
jgi:drug/metabolite transporter (DMT)-like permease